MKMFVPALYLCLGSSLAFGQAAITPATTTQTPVPTLRAQAKLVVVDVVVTDKNHNAVHNLKRDDFTLLENKTPQNVLSFDEHAPLSAGERVKLSPTPILPPGVFANLVPAPVNSAVNVLLIDSLNTPLTDQQYLHQQLLQYLKTVPPGTSIAIFGLSSRLVMLQGFTSDPAILRRVVEQKFGHASPLISDNVGGGSDAGNDSPAAIASSLGIPMSSNFDVFANEVGSSQLLIRSELTLASMNQLARYLASVHGRKNLIWFSGSFPLDLTVPANGGSFSNPGLDLPSGEGQYRQTVNLLARSQVAVYPIDVRGLITSPAFQAAGGGSLAPVTPLNDTSAVANAAEHQAAERIATDSGGRAFYNGNDLTKAIDTAVTEGSSYYTLTYTPSEQGKINSYRRIEVKLANKDGQLAYRRGYFASDPNSNLSVLTAEAPAGGAKPAAPEIAPLRRAMVHGSPTPSEILFKTRVLPAKGLDHDPAPNNVYTPAGLADVRDGFRRFIVDFDTEGHDYAFPAADNGKYHLKAQFAALVYQSDGKLVDTVTTTLVADITEAERAKVLRTGLPFRLQVSVPDHGDYSIRIGVYDFNSDHVGSVEVPVAAVANLPPVDVPLKPAAAPASAKP
jgi:VWFA-related protein